MNIYLYVFIGATQLFLTGLQVVVEGGLSAGKRPEREGKEWWISDHLEMQWAEMWASHMQEAAEFNLSMYQSENLFTLERHWITMYRITIECSLQFQICSGLFSTPLFSIAVLHAFSNHPFILSNYFLKKEYWPFTGEILHKSIILGLRLLMCEISLLKKKAMLTMKWERIHFKSFYILHLLHFDLKLKNMPA